MSYTIEDLNEVKYPSRKPWLIILAVVVAGIIGWLVYRGGHGKAADIKEEPPAPESKVSETQKAKSQPPSNLLPETKQNRQKEVVLDIAVVVARAKKAEASGNLVEARGTYTALLKHLGAGKAGREIEDALGRINIKLALTPAKMPEKVDYVVKSGDSVEKIAKNYDTTSEQVQLGNNLANPNLIKAGDSLRILPGGFKMEISKKNNTLILFYKGDFFRKYSVGTGQFGKTPVGTFVVSDRIVQPPWWRPDGKVIPFGDPENILGTRWLAIKASGGTPDVKGYGIHGTWDETTIGKAVSAGCIRMRNAEVEEVFNLVPLGTQVVIHE